MDKNREKGLNMLINDFPARECPKCGTELKPVNILGSKWYQCPECDYKESYSSEFEETDDDRIKLEESLPTDTEDDDNEIQNQSQR